MSIINGSETNLVYNKHTASQEAEKLSFSSALSAEGWFQRGLDDDIADRPEAAILSYRNALNNDPLHVPALYNLGRLLYCLGDLDQSEKFLQRAISLSPQHSRTLLLLGHICSARQKPEEALSLYEEAERANPSYPLVYLSLMRIYDYLGLHDQAINARSKYKELGDQLSGNGTAA